MKGHCRLLQFVVPRALSSERDIANMLKPPFALIAILALLSMHDLCAAEDAKQVVNVKPASAGQRGYDHTTVEGCLESTLISQCRTTGHLQRGNESYPGYYSGRPFPSALVWRTDFTCCKEKSHHRTDDFSGYVASKPRVSQCDWRVEYYKEVAASGTEKLMFMEQGDGTLKAGDAFGVCRIDAKADDCEGQAFCEDGMTLTVQGGYYIMAAYSKEPGNLGKAPKGDLCESMETLSQYNNLFCDRADPSGGTDVNLDDLYDQLNIPPHKSAPRHKASPVSGHDKHGLRRLLQHTPSEPYLTSFVAANLDVFVAVNDQGYYAEALTALGLSSGGPRDCTTANSAPIQGGPYGGIAYSIIGTAQVSTESGKFAEVGRLEHTVTFVALGQNLQATQDLPWVKGGGLKLSLRLNDGPRY